MLHASTGAATRQAQDHETACNVVMQLTIDADAITPLRQLAMRHCGDGLQFMRVALCTDTRRARVELCIGAAMAAPVMAAILQQLPAAQFGRIAATSLRSVRALRRPGNAPASAFSG